MALADSAMVISGMEGLSSEDRDQSDDPPLAAGDV
jgi:hypothetical protein